MNAPVQIAHLGNVEDFIEVCDTHTWFYDNSWISLQTAVDNLQSLARRWGLIDEFGQDAIQQMIAFNQVIEPPAPSEYEANYVARIITQWEADDAARPPPRPAKVAEYRPASSTVDAFFWVARSQPAEYLAGWLARHPQDAPHLHKLWIEKCSQTKT